ncbi:MAG: lipoyl(octanoyl) transferase LipB [Pseudomonadota bacterium]
MTVEIRIAETPVAYPDAIAAMEARAEAVRDAGAPELLWLLEHPPLYTAGTSADPADLRDPDRFPVFETGRGGQYTYHGPGQRVGYFICDLKARDLGVREYVQALEDWVIGALAAFNVKGERRDGRVGVWVDRGAGHEDKIAALGVRVRRWVAFHGIALNVEPDLAHFDGITPCGVGAITDGVKTGVTSLVDLGLPVTMTDADAALIAAFKTVFEPTTSELLIA